MIASTTTEENRRWGRNGRWRELGTRGLDEDKTMRRRDKEGKEEERENGRTSLIG